jgi:hypothetical protein
MTPHRDLGLLDHVTMEGSSATHARHARVNVLDQCADAMAIDRHDETSYDSSEFPKVVLHIDLADDDHCGTCHNQL